MKKKFLKKSLISMTVITLLGFILIIFSGNIGESKGDYKVITNGGMMDTSQYDRIVESTTENYRTVGFILSLIGGVGLLASGYEYYKTLQ